MFTVPSEDQSASSVSFTYSVMFVSAYDGTAADTQIAAIAARIIFVSISFAFLCLSLRAIPNAASVPMPFPASSLASFAICRSQPLVPQLKIGNMLAHPSAIRQSPGGVLQGLQKLRGNGWW